MAESNLKCITAEPARGHTQREGHESETGKTCRCFEIISQSEGRPIVRNQLHRYREGSC